MVPRPYFTERGAPSTSSTWLWEIPVLTPATPAWSLSMEQLMVTAPRLDMISGSRARAFPPPARESSRQPASSPRVIRWFTKNIMGTS